MKLEFKKQTELINTMYQKVKLLLIKLIKQKLKQNESNNTKKNIENRYVAKTQSPIASVSLITKAIDSLVGFYEDISTPAHIFAVNRPATILANRRYILADNFDVTKATSYIECLRQKKNICINILVKFERNILKVDALPMRSMILTHLAKSMSHRFHLLKIQSISRPHPGRLLWHSQHSRWKPRPT